MSGVSVALDAGGIVHASPLVMQQAIDAVFLTHVHPDKVKNLGFPVASSSYEFGAYA